MCANIPAFPTCAASLPGSKLEPGHDFAAQTLPTGELGFPRLKLKRAVTNPGHRTKSAWLIRLFLLLVTCGAEQAIDRLVAGPFAEESPQTTVSAPKTGDADFPTPSPSARHSEKVAAVKSGRYDLVLIGDSITQTVGEGGDEWVALKAVWDKHYAPRHAINLGYSGYRTENILWNLENGELDFTNSPKVAMLLIGTNNTDDQHYPRVHSAEQVFAGTKAIVDLIRERHPSTKILILRIFPCGGPGDRTDYHRTYNRSAQAIEATRQAGELTAHLADGKNVFWRDIGYVFLRTDGAINTDLMPDLIHPNAAGAEAWAQAVEPTLAQLMGDEPIVTDQPNSAVVPVPKLEEDCYDWWARHRQVLEIQARVRPEIVFIGDSITHFWGGPPYTPGAPVHGPRSWETLLGTRPALNLGFGWDRTQNVLWRLDHGELDGIHPRIVVVNIGSNNTSGTAHARQNTPAEIVAGIRLIILRIRAKLPDARIILMGIFPREEHPDHWRRQEINEINRKLTAEFGAVAGITWLDIGPKLLAPNGTISRGLMSDFCHPTERGYQIWADALAPLLQEINASTSTPKPAAVPRPSPQQAAWLDAGIGIFVHWAPNVYQGTEGDNLSTPTNRINPDRFDAKAIVEAAKSANAGYLIFVAKHVGGYCAWQTDTTDYSLKTSPWENGHGDMVGDLARACRDEGLRFGVYLSPRSDIHHVGTGGKADTADKQKEYNAIYRRQLTEILTKYGPMFEMWFDGGNVVPVNDLIARLAPEIITFQGRRTNSTRWVGTEDGFAPYPCWNTIDWQAGETPKEGAGTPTGNLWCPAECDVSILRPNWFWSRGCDSRVLPLDQLIEIYYLSVGRGVNLLLNITPDDHGAIPEAQVRRLREFGEDIRRRFAKPLFTTSGQSDSLLLDFGGTKTIDHIMVREDIHQGERTRRFTIEGRQPDGHWTVLAEGTQVGNRQIFPMAATDLAAVRFIVKESTAPVRIRELSVFNVNQPVPQRAYRMVRPEK